MNSSRSPRVFISFRTASGNDEAAYFEEKLAEQGIKVLRISKTLPYPHPRGTVKEWDDWSKLLNAAIRGIPHFVVVASEAADRSQWISWEILSSFGTARCLYICWISGPDPREWVTPLPALAYWLFPGPSAFLIDCREIVSAHPVLRIGFPNLLTRVLYGVSVLADLTFAALSFYFVSRALPKFGFPVDSYGNRAASVLTAAFMLVVLWPRRAVFAYWVQRWKLKKTKLVFSGQTGSRIALLIFLLAALLTSLIVPIFHLTLTTFAGVILLILHNAFYHSYRFLVGYPLGRINASLLTKGAHRTAQELDAKRERGEKAETTKNA